MPHDIFVTIQKLMGDAVKKQYGLTTGSRITVLWFAWFRDGLFTAVRSDDWRAVVVSSDLPYSVYFEVTYDITANSYYIDRHTSEDRTVIPGV